MNSSEEARDILAEADRLRSISESAARAREAIEEGQVPQLVKGAFFIPKSFTYSDKLFSEDETKALFEALEVVRDEYESRAEREEKRVHTVEITFQDE